MIPKYVLWLRIVGSVPALLNPYFAYWLNWIAPIKDHKDLRQTLVRIK